MNLTNKQLSALPELQEYRNEILPNGNTVRHRIVHKFVANKIEDDRVILFHDENGSWRVHYHLEGGPYKSRFYFP